jgi:hypothetical protein
MPITHKIDHEQRLVSATPHGVLTDREIFAYQMEVWSGSEVLGYSELIDMSAVVEIEFVSANRVFELAKLSESMDPPAAPSKLAIVATADVHFGLARMYEAYRGSGKEGTKTPRVFRNRAEALQWLGVSAEE